MVERGALLKSIAKRAVFQGRPFCQYEANQPLLDGTTVVHIQVKENVKQQQQQQAVYWYNQKDAIQTWRATFDVYTWGEGGQWWRYTAKNKEKEPTRQKPPPNGFCVYENNTVNAAALPLEDQNVPWYPIVFGTRLLGPAAIAASPQELALRSIKGTKCLLIAFQVDYGKGTQSFFTVPSWDYFESKILCITEPRLRNFYEYIPNDVRVRFYLDFDCSRKDFADLMVQYQPSELKQKLATTITETFQTSYAETNDSQHLQLFFTNSSNEQKTSFHVLGGSLVVWENTAALKSFVAKIRKTFFEALHLTNHADKTRRELLIDMGVYDKNKKFRLAFCTKRNQERYLEPMDGWRPKKYEEYTVCIQQQQQEPVSIMGRIIQEDDKQVRTWACKESQLHSSCPELAAFIEPYRQPTNKGGQHNVRWLRGNTGSELFHLPPEAFNQLYSAMAKAIHMGQRLLLHEAPLGWQRLAIDVDGGNVDSIGKMVSHISRVIGVTVPCHVSAAPSKTKTNSELRWLHLTFHCILPCGGAVARAVSKRIKSACPAEWAIDASFSALRTLYSDKIDQETGQFSERVYRYMGCWLGNQQQQVPYEGDVLLAQIAACSRLVANQDSEPRLPLTEKEEEMAVASPVGEGAKASQELLNLFAIELEPVFGNAKPIGRAKVLDTGDAIALVMDTKWCLCGREHRNSKKQSAVFFARGWQQRAINDETCTSHSPVWHQYRNRMAILMCRPEWQEEEGKEEKVISLENVKSIVLSVYPGDAELWRTNRVTWYGKTEFAPNGHQVLLVRYRFGAFSLLRQSRNGTSEIQRITAPAQITSGFKFDTALGQSLTEACIEAYQSPGIMELERDCIVFPNVGTLKYGLSPARFVKQGAAPPNKVGAELATKCAAFYGSIRLLPVDLDALAMEAKRQWLKQVLDGDESRFVMDNGGEREAIQLSKEHLAPSEYTILLVGPCGCQKTTAMINAEFKGDIATNLRRLVLNLATRFDFAKYCDHSGLNVRSTSELELEQCLCWVVNSIEKATRGRTIDALFADEITATLHGIVSSTLMTDQVGRGVMLKFQSLLQKVPRLVLASADITPELEGHFVKSLLKQRPNMRVIYKVRGPSAAATRCIELATDAEFWQTYARILVYNAEQESLNACIHVFIPCSTAAAVQKARLLCQRLWPVGLAQWAVFLDSSTLAPPLFIEQPNESWVQYAIVCISPTAKVGLSFEVDGHFHLTMAYVASGCGTSQDVNQLLQRVRPALSLLLIRIRLMGPLKRDGGSAKEDVEKTIVALDAHSHQLGIDRSLFQPPSTGKESDDAYETLSVLVEEQTRLNHANFVYHVRHDLRKRQMTVELGGLAVLNNNNNNNNCLPDFVLPPLPANVDLSGPNKKQDRVDAILAARDVLHQEVDMLLRNRKGNEAVIERYMIRKMYLANGPYSFEELVEKHVKDKFEEKVARARIVMQPVPHEAASVDERDLQTGAAPRERQHAMVKRAAWNDLVQVLPEFELEKRYYQIKRSRIEENAQDILASQLKRMKQLSLTPSSASGSVKCIISNHNKALRAMGMPPLEPENKHERPCQSWVLSNDNLPPVLCYADIGGMPMAAVAAAATAIEQQHVLVDPEIHDAYLLSSEDGASFDLDPFPSHAKMVYLHCHGAFVLTESFTNTLRHALLTRAGVPGARFDLEPVLFHRGTLLRAVISATKGHAKLLEELKTILDQMTLTCNNRLVPATHQPPPHQPTHCLSRRVRLVPIGRKADGSQIWKMQDESVYNNNNNNNNS